MKVIFLLFLVISSPKKVSHKSVHPMNPSLVSSNSIIKSRLTSKINDVKRKRNIDEYEQFDDESNEDDEKKIDNKLHPKIKETSAQSHDNIAGRFSYTFMTISYLKLMN
jgi:hypothetical protein